jgi:two-component system, NtrC family, response regulator AtoC
MKTVEEWPPWQVESEGESSSDLEYLRRVRRSPDRREDSTGSLSLIDRSGRPRLAVLGGDVITTYPLPPAGELVIGRDADCDVRIEDPSVSRRHAVVRAGEVMTVEDLGSSNGTFVRGERLAANAPAVIAVNEIVTIGAIAVVVQASARAARQRTLWSHGYFELRLAEECTRAERGNGKFGLLRVRGSGLTDAAVDALSSALRDVDVVGTYAPDEWEVMLLDADPDEVRRVANLVRAALPGARIAQANYPGDGRDAWTLAAAATARLSDAPAVPATAGEAAYVTAAVGPMRAVLDLVERIAVGDISVLVLGETGVGKEVVAEWIHQRSRRAGKPLLKLNCAALPEALLESELFGYERGAFTGAVAAKPGLLEQATGGTVFLDEIGELPAGTQAKLLRVIEQRELLRVGALRARAIDVRFIAATHRDLEAAITTGRFREDLYFRLAGVTVSVPPLRARPDELLPLINRFAARAAAALDRSPPRISPDAIALLQRYRWPGNIRELRNVIDRATLLADGVIEPHHLPEDRMSRPAVVAPAEDGGAAPAPPGAATAAGGDDKDKAASLRERSDALARAAIEDALAKTGGNQTEAARLLGIARRTLTNKLNQFGFDRPRKR